MQIGRTFYHRGYYTKIQYSTEDNCYYGVLEGLRDSISFEGGKTEQDFEENFHLAVDDYIEILTKLGVI